MSQIIPIYIPTFISDATYSPSRVLPHIYFYNGLIDCEEWWLESGSLTTSGVSYSQTRFPYFDNYNVISGSQFPTTDSLSLLFNNENASYGEVPIESLYTTYWEKYIQFLYNPKTRVLNCQAIIPLADYFQIELNDIVNFRGNYWHLRAINDYSLKTGECNLQLLGPIISDVFDVVPPPPPAQASSSVSWSYTEFSQNGEFKVYDNASTIATLTANGSGNSQISESHTITATLVPVSYPGTSSVTMSIYVNGDATTSSIAYTNTTISASFLVGSAQNYTITGSIRYNPPPLDADLKVFLDAGDSTSYPGSGTTWYDLTTNGNNVTLTGSVTYNSTTGSFYFSGSNNYAFTQAASNLSVGTGNQTTILWTRYLGPTGSNDYIYAYENGYDLTAAGESNIMVFADSGFSYKFEMFYGPNNLASYMPSFDYTPWSYTKTTMNNVWYQCAMVRTGNVVYYYINGAQINGRPGFSSNSLTNTNSLYIGKSRSYNTGYVGDISMFSIWNKALTTTEILNDFNTYKARYGY